MHTELCDKCIPSTDISSKIVVEFTDDLDVVTGHHHLALDISGTLRPFQANGGISSPHEQLRLVVDCERRVSSTLILGQNLLTSAMS